MSCTCCRVRLLTGLPDWVTMTRASQATGVKVRFWSSGLALPARALPPRSAAPLATASMPDAVLNGCSSILPCPARSQARASLSKTLVAVATSPRQTSLVLAGEAVWDLECVELPAARLGAPRQSPMRAVEIKLAERKDMVDTNLRS